MEALGGSQMRIYPRQVNDLQPRNVQLLWLDNGKEYKPGAFRSVLLGRSMLTLSLFSWQTDNINWCLLSYK